MFYVLAAYNDMLPVTDPATNETMHLIGFQSRIGGQRFPTWMGNAAGGFYAGAMYAIGSESQEYRLNEVNGRNDFHKPPLVATRAYALSPFQCEGEEVIYFGGHDANGNPSHDMAWVFSTSVENALGRGE